MKKYAKIFTLVSLFFFILPASANDSRSWLMYFMTLSEAERLVEIDNVSQLSIAEQTKRIPALLVLLDDYNLAIRMKVAIELGQMASISQAAIPYLIHNFKYPNAREGEEYVQVVYLYGKAAIPELKKALSDEHWLIRDRACQAIQRINQLKKSAGSCNQLVMR